MQAEKPITWICVLHEQYVSLCHYNVDRNTNIAFTGSACKALHTLSISIKRGVDITYRLLNKNIAFNDTKPC